MSHPVTTSYIRVTVLSCAVTEYVMTSSLRPVQAYRTFRALRVVLAIAAGAFAAVSMSTAVTSGVAVHVPALFAAASLVSSVLAVVCNKFVRLLTFKPYEHHRR